MDVIRDSGSPPAYLTVEGRHLLEDRMRQLEVRCRELRSAIEDADRDTTVVEEYQRARFELDQLSAVLADALAIDDVPDNPDVVGVGDAVDIRLEDGSHEHYVIVHPMEASVDDQRISPESPLACALLGQHVGMTVEVQVRSGAYRCTIMSATRQDQQDA